MPKKSSKKSGSEKTTKKSTTKRKTNSKKLETKIIDNLVKLQKVHTDLGEKFENLADQISTLLALFEVTAKNFAKNPELKIAQKDREFLEKIDKLLDQNKTIAKGLTMMEKRVREKVYSPIGRNLPHQRNPQLTRKYKPSEF